MERVADAPGRTSRCDDADTGADGTVRHGLYQRLQRLPILYPRLSHADDRNDGAQPRRRTFREREHLPDVPTLADCFTAAGYQTGAVGKVHVYPQRARIGFHEVISNEEGRHYLGGGADDWELHLADQAYAGRATGFNLVATRAPSGLKCAKSRLGFQRVRLNDGGAGCSRHDGQR